MPSYQQVLVKLGIQLMLCCLVLVHLTGGEVLVTGRVAQQAVAHQGDCFYGQLLHSQLQREV